MFTRILATIGLAFSVTSANALVLSGYQETEDGKVVNLSGLEWLTWDETANISRTDIENGAGGFLEAGWRYATRNEFEDLFDSLWGGTHEGEHVSNFDGARWLAENLDRTLGGGQHLFFGATGECNVDIETSCLGGYLFDPTESTGDFQDLYGLSTGAFPGNDNYFEENSIDDQVLSSALVRAPSAVPVPASAPLLLAGIAGLAALGRRRKRKAG